MKKMVSILMTVTVAGLIFVQPSLAGSIGHRQVMQNKRIQQGLQSGELTRREARHLFRQQHRIQHSKKQAWSDGTLTWREKKRVAMQQDKASRKIFHLKHNARERNYQRRANLDYRQYPRYRGF